MKNIQVIDGAVNCVYDIFSATDEEFSCIFREGQDIAFIEDLRAAADTERVGKALANIWERRVLKPQANGIHGILFYGLPEKKAYYPTLRDEEACNPGGSRLR